MSHLEGTDRKLDAIYSRLSRIESEIAALKVKSGVWGAVAGAITTIGALLAALFAGVLS